MGTKFSKKKKPVEKQKRPRRYGKVNDYLLEPIRKRPKTSQSLRNAKFIATLGQQGRSATMTDLNKETTETSNKPIPRWQSKWEIDMRPDPSKERLYPLRTWKSMPLPTSERASATSKVSSGKRQSNSRRSKRGRSRERRGTYGRTASGAMPSVEEPDKFDIQSIASYKVDERKMLHKSYDRTKIALDLTAQLWHYEPKKQNKAWFLGPDNQHKNLAENTVSFENMPRQSKPFTSFVNLVRPLARMEHIKSKTEPVTVSMQATIIEEE